MEGPDLVSTKCLCCGYPTLNSRFEWETCFLCRWEDELGSDDAPDEVVGGANSDYSLSEARRNFITNLIKYRKSDSRYFHLRNESIDALKLGIMNLYEKKEKLDDFNDIKEINMKIDKLKNKIDDEVEKNWKKNNP